MEVLDIMARGRNRGKDVCKGKELLVPKRDVDGLVRALDGVRWCDEDSVWELGVLLGRWSVRLRGEVLRRCVDDGEFFEG